jgi:signal transduction histidine kinase
MLDVVELIEQPALATAATSVLERLEEAGPEAAPQESTFEFGGGDDTRILRGERLTVDDATFFLLQMAPISSVRGSPSEALIVTPDTDMGVVLTHFKLAVVFLDEHLCVRSFCVRAQDYFRLLDRDIGRPLLDVVTDLDVPDLADQLHAVLETGVAFERRVRRIGSKLPDLSLQISARELTPGRRGIFLSITDLGELVQAEDRQARFLRFLDHAPVAMFAKDRKGRYWYKNRLAEQVAGPGVGNTDAEVFPKELAAKVETDDRRILESGQTERLWETIPVDGHHQDFLTVKFAIGNEGVGGIAVALEALDVGSAVEADHARWRTIVDAASLAVLIRSGEQWIDLDDRYRQLTGVVASDRLEAVHPDDLDHVVESLQASVPSVRCRLRTDDGSWIYVEIAQPSIEAPDDERIYVILDRTEDALALARLGSELSQVQSLMEARTATLESNVTSLAARNADLDSFAHAAAHDLKAPLRAMVAFSELAADEIGADHPAQAHLKRIEESSARMASMVDSLLRLASAGRDALAIRPCNLNAVFAQVLSDLGPDIEQAGATIDIEELPEVTGDSTAIGVVFQNLVANSLKYRTDRPPRITVDARIEGEHVVVNVADNGIGFAQEQAVEIFEPFRRLHSRDRFEGSGVGLAICKRLVSRLGGEIWATSVEGDGTTVTVQLPATQART